MNYLSVIFLPIMLDHSSGEVGRMPICVKISVITLILSVVLFSLGVLSSLGILSEKYEEKFLRTAFALTILSFLVMMIDALYTYW